MRVGSLLQVRVGARVWPRRLRHVPGVQRRRPGRRCAHADSGDLAGRRAHRRRCAAVARPRRAPASASRSSTSASATAWREPARQGAAAASTRSTPIQSFDHTSGKPDIAGLSNDDQPTSHGANVAQVVWDIAPGARYTFVNYHTAARALAGRRLAHQRARTASRASTSSSTRTPSSTARSTAPAWPRRRSTARTTPASSGSTRRATTRSATGRASVGDADKDGWADIGPAGPRLPRRSRSPRASAWARRCTGRRARKDGAPIAARACSYQLDVTDTAPSAPVVLARGQSDAVLPAGVRRLHGRRRRAPTRCACSSSTPGRRSATSRSSAAASSSATRPTVDVEHPDAGRRARLVHRRRARTGRATRAATFSSRARPRTGASSPTWWRPHARSSGPGIAMVGTSASAPHVAGAAALLMQRDRAAGQPSDPDTIAHELESTGARPRRRPAPTRSPATGRIRLDLDPPDVGLDDARGRAARRRLRALRHRRRRRRHDRGLGRLDRRRGDRRGAGRCCTSASTCARSRRGPHTAVFWVRDMAGNASEHDGAVRARRHAAGRSVLSSRRRSARRRRHRRRVAHREPGRCTIDDVTGRSALSTARCR